jgi:hypothetical protein
LHPENSSQLIAVNCHQSVARPNIRPRNSIRSDHINLTAENLTTASVSCPVAHDKHQHKSPGEKSDQEVTLR